MNSPNEPTKLEVLTAPIVSNLILIYLHLWILEGAIRKWVPGMGNLFYFARDLIVMIVLIALIFWPARRRSRSTILLMLVGILILAILFSALINMTPFAVLFIGIKSYVFPLIVVYLASVYAGGDLFTRIVRNLVPYAYIMLLVVILQVVSPPDSTINWQVGTEEAYFINAGVVRASATFSSPAGLTGFLPVLLIASLWSIQKDRGWMRVYAAIAVLFTLTTIGLSGSRGAVLSGLIVMGIYLIRISFTLNIKDLIKNSVFLGFCLISLTQLTNLFPEVLASFLKRFETAAAAESSTTRILDQAFEYLFWPVSILGDGAGMRMHSGAALGSVLQWVEFDNTKIVAELGLLGVILVSAKIVIGIVLFIRHSAFPFGSTLEQCLIASVLGPILVYGVITQYPSAQAAFVVLAVMWITQKRQGRSRALAGENLYSPKTASSGGLQ